MASRFVVEGDRIWEHGNVSEIRPSGSRSPFHHEIKPGLLNAIIAESAIPRDEFIKDLQSL
jgi:hypothetical protein